MQQIMRNLNRRSFLKSSSALIATTGAGVAAFSNAATFNNEILIYIFLRGGIDGLNVVVPSGSNDHQYYSLMRNTLAIPLSGNGAALPIPNSNFGFHPGAQPLLNLYNSGDLAIIHAAGTPNPLASRSHFDAEKYMELGTPGIAVGSSGWLHRHFDAMANQLNLLPDNILIPIISFRSTPPVSLLGNNSTLTVYDPGSFRLDNAHWRWGVDDPNGSYDDQDYKQLQLLADLYDNNGDFVEMAGAQALTAENILRENYNDAYQDTINTLYPENTFSQRMSDIAQLIKLDPDIGLRLVTLDYGGWDTHTGQNDGNFFTDNLAEVCGALEAFFNDLNSSGGDYADRVTVIIESEFGRRAFENAERGTDHGNGNIMLAIGKNVNGGQIYGTWPGLYPGSDWVNYPNPLNGSWEPELFEGALSVTTDFRRVISEYLLARGQHTLTTLNYVFPNYGGYSPLGIFTQIPETPMFSGGFEN